MYVRIHRRDKMTRMEAQREYIERKRVHERIHNEPIGTSHASGNDDSDVYRLSHSGLQEEKGTI